MAQNIAKVEIHYLFNTQTGETADWKYVS